MALLSEIGTVTTSSKTPKVNWLRDRIQPFYELKMPDILERKNPINTIRVEVAGERNPAAGNHQISIHLLRVTYENGKVETIPTTDPRFNFVGNWGKYNSTSYSNEARISAVKGDYFEIQIPGAKVEILSNNSTIRGIANVYVNGVLYGKFDQYSPKTTYNTPSIVLENLPVTSVETIPGEWISFPLGIFILSTPTKEEINGMIYRDVEAYDGLIVLQENKISERVTAPVGQTYHSFILEMFEAAGITKWNIEPSSKEITTALEWSIGTDYLKIINDLLAALNYTPLWTDENGFYISSLYRSPSEESADISYKADEFSVIYNGMSEELDLFNVPNHWIMVLNDPEREPLVSYYRNDNPESPTSYQNRGRWIVDFREVTDIADQEALDAYTERIAFAASQVYGKVEFETAAMPIHGYSDVIEIDNEALGISGTYSETDWTLTLDVGARMKHKVRRVINIDGEAVT